MQSLAPHPSYFFVEFLREEVAKYGTTFCQELQHFEGHVALGEEELYVLSTSWKSESSNSSLPQPNNSEKDFPSLFFPSLLHRDLFLCADPAGLILCILPGCDLVKIRTPR